LDLARSFTALLIFTAAVGAAASTDFPIREAKWIIPSAQLETLSTKPALCANMGGYSPDDIYDIMIADSAFKTPLLLGGQAARAGLSCASCHPNGRANKAFLFPGLSGDPGTADVTSSIMSHHRGDFVFNPKPIPDLATDPPKISRDPASPALKSFIRGLIVEEFDGPEPPPAVLTALETYVRSLRADACPAKPSVPISLTGDIDDAMVALAAAQMATKRSDPETAKLMMNAARTMLGKVYERYSGDRLAKQRAAIIALDKRIQQANLRIDTISTAELRPLQVATKQLAAKIAPLEAKSLYNRAMLYRALTR
jgi:hypothetical protein